MAGWTEFEARGEGKLARMLSMIELSDFASYYLALFSCEGLAVQGG